MAHLVRLAQAGASGLCVVAVVYLTLLLRSLRTQASPSMQKTVRFCGGVFLAMAIVLAASSWQSASHAELVALRDENAKYRDVLNALAATTDARVAFEECYDRGIRKNATDLLCTLVDSLEKTVEKARQEHLIP